MFSLSRKKRGVLKVTLNIIGDVKGVEFTLLRLKNKIDKEIFERNK